MLCLSKLKSNYYKCYVKTVKMINEILKNTRKNEKLTAKELATQLNVSTSLIYEWEHGRANPSINELIKLANIFETSIDYLVGRTDEFELVKNENSLSKNESELLSLFKKLDTIKQNKVIGYCYALAN